MAKGVVLGLVAGAAVGGGAVWVLRTPATGGSLDGSSAGGGAMVSVPADELAALRAAAAGPATPTPTDPSTPPPPAPDTDRALEEARRVQADQAAEVERLRAELAKLRTAPASDPAASAGGTTANDRFRFGLAGKTPVFDGADWTELGGHLTALAEVIGELRTAISEGREMDMATRQKLMQHNSPLAAFALQATKELGGTGPNGAYTHPAVMAQLIRAALANANAPLTPAQEASIAAAGDAWVATAQRLSAGYTDTTLALQKTVDEADAKQQFLDRARAALTAEQQAVLFPPSTAGRAQLDLFSPALIYAMRMPLTRTSREELEVSLTQTLLQAAGLTNADPATYRHLATAWLDALPDALVPRAGRDPDVMFPLFVRIQTAARAQIAIMEKFLALGELTDAQAAQLRGNGTLVMPQLLQGE